MLGNVEEITKIYYAMYPDIISEEAESVKKSRADFYDYIEKSGIVGNAGGSERKMRLDDLVVKIACEHEQQGFLNGFRYALNLLADEKSTLR